MILIHVANLADGIPLSRLQYTFRLAVFFKSGFLGQSSGQRIISNSWKKILKKTKYWWRNGGFTFSPEVKVYILIDSPMARMQSTETIFTGITRTDVTNWLLFSWSALLFWLPSSFGNRCNSIKLQVKVDHVKNMDPFEKAKAANNKWKYINEWRCESSPHGWSYSYRIRRAKKSREEKRKVM